MDLFNKLAFGFIDSRLIQEFDNQGFAAIVFDQVVDLRNRRFIIFEDDELK